MNPIEPTDVPIDFVGQIPTGTILNGIYQIDEWIAQGGMAEVYRGHNLELGNSVAIKILLPNSTDDELYFKLFQREAEVLSHLSHKSIVKYHVFTKDPDLNKHYLAMEFIEGQSLASRIEEGPLDTETAKHIIIEVARGLQAAHDEGVIHRDLSPDNIVLINTDSQTKVKIIDFGIAKSTKLHNKSIIGKKFAGKYNFASPEQLGKFNEEVTHSSDIYSLGLVFAATLLGHTLDMEGTIDQTLKKRTTVPDLSAISSKYRPTITAMLQPTPSSRPASMRCVVKLLTASFNHNNNQEKQTIKLKNSQIFNSKISNLPQQMVFSITLIIVVLTNFIINNTNQNEITWIYSFNNYQKKLISAQQKEFVLKAKQKLIDKQKKIVDTCNALTSFSSDPNASTNSISIKNIRNPDAIVYCNNAIKIFPTNKTLLFQLGRAYDADGQYEFAKKYYSSSSDFGHGPAMVNLGLLLLVNGDFKNGTLWLKKAAKISNFRAMNQLGLLFEKGRYGGTIDIRKAIDWYKLAADNNYLHAIHNLAKVLNNPKNHLSNHKKAYLLFKKASDQGHSGSSYELAKLTAFGKYSTEKNSQISAKYYLKSIQQKEGYQKNHIDNIHKITNSVCINIQNYLAQNNFYYDQIDGKCGKDTKIALKKYRNLRSN